MTGALKEVICCECGKSVDTQHAHVCLTNHHLGRQEWLCDDCTIREDYALYLHRKREFSPICSQCGQEWGAPACGPTHAAVKAQEDYFAT